MNRGDGSPLPVTPQRLHYKREREVSRIEVKTQGEDVEEELVVNPFFCWMKVLLCPIIFPVLIIYEFFCFSDTAFDNEDVSTESDDDSETYEEGCLLQTKMILISCWSSTYEALLVGLGMSSSTRGRSRTESSGSGNPAGGHHALSRKELSRKQPSNRVLMETEMMRSSSSKRLLSPDMMEDSQEKEVARSKYMIHPHPVSMKIYPSHHSTDHTPMQMTTNSQ